MFGVMIASRFNIVFYGCILSLFLFSSCEQHIEEEENTYQIVSMLIKKTQRKSNLPPSFPPSPDKGTLHRFTVKDSLNIYKYYFEQSFKSWVIEVNNNMSGTNTKYNLKSNCVYRSNELLKHYYSLKNDVFLDINKISSANNLDSIINKDNSNKIYSDLKLGKPKMRVSFSRIAFDKNYSKALLVMSVEFGKLDGFSALIFLEKEYFHWKIKCEKLLTIS